MPTTYEQLERNYDAARRRIHELETELSVCQSFYKLTVKERDFERQCANSLSMMVATLQRKLDER